MNISVSKGEGVPQTLLKRGPQGEYQVILTASDRRWAQFAFQFSHELCHILSNYDIHSQSVIGTHTGAHQATPTQWFEETLCEMASLYCLRQMATEWTSSAPYPDLTDYASALQEYAHGRLTDSRRQLPPTLDLRDWFKCNQPALAKDPYLRDMNGLVANQLLPLVENNHEYWGALNYLNIREPNPSHTMEQVLRIWHVDCPPDLAGFVDEVSELLGLNFSR